MNPTTSNVTYDKQQLHIQLADYIKQNENNLKNHRCFNKLSLSGKAAWTGLLYTSLFPYIEGLMQSSVYRPSLFKDFLGFINVNGFRISDDKPRDMYDVGASIICCAALAFNIRDFGKSVLQLKDHLKNTNAINELIEKIITKNTNDLDEEDTKLINQLNETEAIRQRFTNRSKWSLIGELVSKTSIIVMLGVVESATYIDLSKDYTIKQLYCSALYITAGSGLYYYTKMRQNDIDVEYLGKMTEILKKMLPETSM